MPDGESQGVEADRAVFEETSKAGKRGSEAAGEVSAIKHTIRNLLRAEKIELWTGPFSLADGSGAISMGLAERYARQVCGSAWLSTPRRLA